MEVTMIVACFQMMDEGLETNIFNIPEDEPLGGCKFTPFPYFLLGDDIFPLKKWLIKPYPGRNLSEELKIYSYWLSCARCVTENAFGFLAARWRISHRPVWATIGYVELYMLAALPLHNYIHMTSNAMYTPNGFVDSESRAGSIHLGEWHNRDICSGFNNIRPIRGNRNRLRWFKFTMKLKNTWTPKKGVYHGNKIVLGEHTETIILDVLCIT